PSSIAEGHLRFCRDPPDRCLWIGISTTDIRPYYSKLWWMRRASQEPAIARRIGSVLEKLLVAAGWIGIIIDPSFLSASSFFHCTDALSNSYAPSIHLPLPSQDE